MNEEEWLTCADPKPMRKFLENQRRLKQSWRRRVWERLGYPVYSLSHRQAVLFALACCRLVSFTESSDCAILEAVERFADGGLSAEEMERIANAEYHRPHRYPGESFPSVLASLSQFSAQSNLGLFHHDLIHGDISSLGRIIRFIVGTIASTAFPAPSYRGTTDKWNATYLSTEQAITDILRDVVGPRPFRLTSFSSSWRTDTALSLAQQMYESRDFGAMPILADALQDAGCDNQEVLNHCRDPKQPHVRGCWVVDLVLGKS
jgi:hypothetical protein